MKKFSLFFCALLMLLFTACNSDLNYDEDWGIALAAKNPTATSVTLVIAQSGGDPTGTLEYGAPFRIEEKTESGWQEPKAALTAWAMPAYGVEMNGKKKLKISWEHIYGELPPGDYRIAKEFTDFRAAGDYDTRTYYAEFTIK